MRVVTPEEMRAIDRLTIERVGLPGVVLMENAGRSVASEIAARFSGPRAAVLAGSGNNGGDGYVIARTLSARGWEVSVYLVAPRARIQGDARTHLLAWEGSGGRVHETSEPGALAFYLPDLAAADVIVDALLGTGVDEPVRGVYAEAIDLVRPLRAKKVSVDIPSGVHGGTGQVLGVAFQADLTAACAFPKHGNLHYPGAAYGGALVTVDIGLPREVPGAPPATARCFCDDDADCVLEPAARDAHKGTFGHVLLLAGGPGKGGAALLAARAALLGGAGLVTLGTDPGCQARLEGLVPELMVEGVRAASVEPLLSGKRVVACGPGLGVSEETDRLVHAVLSHHGGPVILDADALTVFAGSVDRLRALHAATVLTPHPGEAARLLGVSVADVQADRSAAARELAARSGAVTVLKGACTVVAEPEGALTFVTTGNPGMGTGGSGDALTGLVAATVSRHGLTADAVCAAVHVHGLAGDIASAALGERSVTAGSLCDHLPQAFARIRAHAGAMLRRD